jgi:hypothetical protein
LSLAIAQHFKVLKTPFLAYPETLLSAVRRRFFRIIQSYAYLCVNQPGVTGMEFLTILIVSVVFMSLIFAGLSINLLFKKNGSFPVTSVGRNKEMRKRGITCVKHDEILCHNKGKNKGSCCG